MDDALADCLRWHAWMGAAFRRLGQFTDAQAHCLASLACNSFRGARGVQMASTGIFFGGGRAAQRVVKRLLAAKASGEHKATANEKAPEHVDRFTVVRTLLQLASISIVVGNEADATRYALQAVQLSASCGAHSRSLARALALTALLSQTGAINDVSRFGGSVTVELACEAAEGEALACGDPPSVAAVQVV